MQDESHKSAQQPRLGRPTKLSKKLPMLLTSMVLATTVLSLPANTAHAAEIIDGDNEPPTQRSDMHACPANTYVVGVHIGKNDFVCSDSFGSPGTEIIDGDNEFATQRGGMHACPSGSAVTGVHVGKNLLLCALLLQGSVKSEFVDGDNEPATQRHGMHTCPLGSVLIGLHTAKNQLLCGSFTSSSAAIATAQSPLPDAEALEKVWVVVSTSNENTSGTDDNLTLEIQTNAERVSRQFVDLSGIDDLETGTSNVYEFDFRDTNINPADIRPGNIRITTDGDDAWLPNSIWVIGQTHTGRVVLLVHRPAWPANAWFSTDPDDAGEPSRPLSQE